MLHLGRVRSLVVLVLAFAASACAGPGGATAEPATVATQPATVATQPALAATQPALDASQPGAEADARARFLAECVPACERRSSMKAVGWQVIQAECARGCEADWAAQR